MLIHQIFSNFLVSKINCLLTDFDGQSSLRLKVLIMLCTILDVFNLDWQWTVITVITVTYYDFMGESDCWSSMQSFLKYKTSATYGRSAGIYFSNRKTKTRAPCCYTSLAVLLKFLAVLLKFLAVLLKFEAAYQTFLVVFSKFWAVFPKRLAVFSSL